ncbi:MAG: RNA polymerase subunit sigma-70 [Chloroflexi bacterium HGW-Chloroflexi-1]|nr:MAG: RNA polymerase subunit sigma-70 [Chloroflexi bacterium HGW-Chloroflexi-1]
MFGLDRLICTLSFAAFSVIQGDKAHTEDSNQLALLERASRADPVALSMLYDQYHSKIFSYVYHQVGQADLAEDLTGQVFMRMLEAIRNDRAWRTSFSGWLYRIAHNLIIDYYRRRQRASFVDIDEAPPIKATQGDPERTVELRLNSERLQAALGQITEEQAQVITLRFLEELSIAEVSAIMNKTAGAIKALQYRAVLALRRVMQP